jgi:hypothetical protein
VERDADGFASIRLTQRFRLWRVWRIARTIQDMTTAVSDNVWIRGMQWLLFAVFVGLGFGWIGAGQSWSKANRLADSTYRATGTITSVQPGNALNAPSVNYGYNVDGQHYSDYASIQSSQVPRVAPGDPIQVIYAPSDPSVSAVDLEATRQAAGIGLRIVLVLEAAVAAFFWGPFLLGYLKSGSVDLPSGNLLTGVVMLLLMVGIGLGSLFFGALPQYRRALELVEHGKAIDAQVTLVYDDDGRYADYAYTVQGDHYTGRTRYTGGYSDRPVLKAFYLADMPSYSSLDPHQEVSSARYAIRFLCVWSLLAGVFLYFVSRRAFVRGP